MQVHHQDWDMPATAEVREVMVVVRVALVAVVVREAMAAVDREEADMELSAVNPAEDLVVEEVVEEKVEEAAVARVTVTMATTTARVLGETISILGWRETCSDMAQEEDEEEEDIEK